MPLRVGETFAGYRILRQLGSGGMGEVYLVQHPRLPRQEALKVLRPDASSDPGFRDRFIREADLAAGLRHPHIVGVHDRGEQDGKLWISMDYIDGSDLGHLVAQRYPAGMPVNLVVLIVAAVASALDYAHKKGLLHRDVKPANIMVADVDSDNPNISLADFGIARPLDDTSGLTATNMTVGTVAYAAPEQLMGDDVDGRTDQYALTATTYHLLTGLQLFPHSNPAVVISRQLSARAPSLADTRPDLAPLDDVLAVGLAKNRDDRFATCADLAHALAGRVSAETEISAIDITQIAPRQLRVSTAVASPMPGTRRLSRRAYWALAAFSAIAGLGAVVFFGSAQTGLQRPPSIAGSSSLSPPPLASSTVFPAETTLVSPQSPSADGATSDLEGTGTIAVALPPPPPPTTLESNPNGPGCSTKHPAQCGRWTPEQAAFACRAIAGGADYSSEGLQRMLMNRYGLDQSSAFFLGKEAWYSVESGGYTRSGSMADGPHPLCNDFIP